MCPREIIVVILSGVIAQLRDNEVEGPAFCVSLHNSRVRVPRVSIL
jgi:hypothetical protein